MKIIVIFVFTLLLAACAPAAPAAPTVDIGAIQTSAVQTAIAAIPTATALPPSPSPIPTSSVKPETVISAFKAAGLEAENARPMTKKDYGLAPFVCQGTRFFIPSLGPDNGGRLFICSDHAERDALKDYYVSMGKKSAALFSWALVKGDVIVQINGNLSEEDSKKYEAAIP